MQNIYQVVRKYKKGLEVIKRDETYVLVHSMANQASYSVVSSKRLDQVTKLAMVASKQVNDFVNVSDDDYKVFIGLLDEFELGPVSFCNRY